MSFESPKKKRKKKWDFYFGNVIPGNFLTLWRTEKKHVWGFISYMYALCVVFLRFKREYYFQTYISALQTKDCHLVGNVSLTCLCECSVVI